MLNRIVGLPRPKTLKNVLKYSELVYQKRDGVLKRMWKSTEVSLLKSTGDGQTYCLSMLDAYEGKYAI